MPLFRRGWRFWPAQMPPVMLRRGVRFWHGATAWLERREWDEGALLMVLGAVIGLAAGLSVVVFYRLVDLSYFIFIDWFGRQLDVGRHVYYRPLLTAAGLWAAWAIVRRARLPDGQNIGDVQLAVAKRGGNVPARRVAVRTVASAATLGSGGSAGGEGPVAVLGSAVGSLIGRALRFHQRRVKILVGCGAAGGISGAFNAPFAGAFFALEQVLGSFAVGAFGPVVIASVVGAITVRAFLGSSPAFRIPSYGEIHGWTVAVLYPLLGIACGLVSILFVRAYFAASDFVRRIPGPPALRPLAGGFFVGAIVLASGGLLVGDGHLEIPESVFGGLAWHILLALALAKILVTVVTLTAGGSGGIFTPTLFVGAALGGALGRLAATVLPGAGVHAETWALVGMAGLVAGATRAPITALFMVFELTDDYTIVLPLMLVTVISYAIARRYEPYGLYDGWLARQGEHLAHGADRALMDRILARDALARDVVTVMPDARLEEIIAAAGRARHTTIPVVDEEHTLTGVITYEDLRQVMLDRRELAPVLIAADLAAPAEVVTPRHSLRDALRVMNARALDVLPVVDREDTSRFVGVLSRADVLAAYERELMQSV